MYLIGRVEHHTALGAIDVEKQNVELEATVKSLSETKLSLRECLWN